MTEDPGNGKVRWGLNLGEERKRAVTTGGLGSPGPLDPLSSLSRHREDATITVRTAWFLSEVECFDFVCLGFLAANAK